MFLCIYFYDYIPFNAVHCFATNTQRKMEDKYCFFVYIFMIIFLSMLFIASLQILYR